MIPGLSLNDSGEPVHKAAQRLRWFVSAFEAQVARVSEDTGNSFAIDHEKLSAVFVAWLAAFNAQKPGDLEARQAYVGFAAGLMLRELITHAPLTVTARPATPDANDPAHFWPEGYVYVAFCLNVRGLVLEQDYHAPQVLSERLYDLRTWWSFRENVEEDPERAISFLDKFASEEPNWSMPNLFRRKAASRISRVIFDGLELPRPPG